MMHREGAESARPADDQVGVALRCDRRDGVDRVLVTAADDELDVDAVGLEGSDLAADLAASVVLVGEARQADPARAKTVVAVNGDQTTAARLDRASALPGRCRRHRGRRLPRSGPVHHALLSSWRGARASARAGAPAPSEGNSPTVATPTGREPIDHRSRDILAALGRQAVEEDRPLPTVRITAMPPPFVSLRCSPPRPDAGSGKTLDSVRRTTDATSATPLRRR